MGIRVNILTYSTNFKSGWIGTVRPMGIRVHIHKVTWKEHKIWICLNCNDEWHMRKETRKPWPPKPRLSHLETVKTALSGETRVSLVQVSLIKFLPQQQGWNLLSRSWMDCTVTLIAGHSRKSFPLCAEYIGKRVLFCISLVPFVEMFNHTSQERTIFDRINYISSIPPWE